MNQSDLLVMPEVCMCCSSKPCSLERPLFNVYQRLFTFLRASEILVSNQEICSTSDMLSVGYQFCFILWSGWWYFPFPLQHLEGSSGGGFHVGSRCDLVKPVSIYLFTDPVQSILLILPKFSRKKPVACPLMSF